MRSAWWISAVQKIIKGYRYKLRTMTSDQGAPIVIEDGKSCSAVPIPAD